MYKISGVIERGFGLGTKISFPTINVAVPKDESMKGVYVCKVKIDAKVDAFGAGYFGEKKGLPSDKFICEIHLLGDNFGDLTGEFAEIEFLEKIRDVQKTKNLEELKTLIRSDVKYIHDRFF
jgi:riboflavin kinase/FMN adenylyltransferase